MPATDLIAPDFLRAVLQSVQCHYRAWTAGIHHKDVALGNLMYSAGMNGEPLGILVDWDIARRKDTTQINRSGTIPFVALDFLRSPDKHIEHLYRHDLEAMFWVLVRACYPKGTFRNWASHNCYVEMLAFSDSDTSKVTISTGKWGPLRRHGIKDDWKGVGVVMGDLNVYWYDRRLKARSMERAAYRARHWGEHAASAGDVDDEESPQQVWQSFCEQLQSTLAILYER
ncbi:hypothetical protein PENSPDRAFT_615504, partial [Peniophora sp. CONT]